MSAEELKTAVREYANENFPGWRSASITIIVGEIGNDDDWERLLVAPTSHQGPGQPPLSPSSHQDA